MSVLDAPPPEALAVVPRTLAKADAYSIVEAARVYKSHPDGLPQVNASQLLVGYPGSGKTLILKKLCWDLLFEPQYVPVYVAIEAYVAMVAGEATYTPDVKLRVPDGAMRACINFLLGLAIVDAVMDAGWPKAAAPAIEALSQGEVGEEPLETLGTRYQSWKRERLKRLTATLSYGAESDQSFSDPPTVFSIARLIADRTQRSGQTLVLLIDQVDRLRPFYFKTLSSLLRRSVYFAIIATRPSPAAPEPTPLDPGAVDHSTHWLGRSAPDSDWSDFLADVIDARDDIDSKLRAQIIKRKATIDSLFRPSVRRVISFTDTIRDRAPSDGLEAAWDYALNKAIEDENNEAIGSLSIVSGSPQSVIRAWQGRARPKAGGRYTGAGFRMPAGGVALSPRVNSFLRTCVRDGILIPRGTAPPKFDQPNTRYEVNPLIALPWANYKDLATFAREPKPFNVGTKDLEDWAARRRPPALAKQERVAISVVGTRADRIASSLVSAVDAAASVDVIHPDDVDVERLVARSGLLVADLSEVTPMLTFAVGTAIARGVPIRTVAASARTAPGWLPLASSNLPDDDEAVSALTFEIFEFLRLPPSPTDRWNSDALGRSLNYRPQADTLTIVASRIRLRVLAKEVTKQLRDRGLGGGFHLLEIESDRPTLSIYDLVKPARQSAAMLVDATATSSKGLALAMLMTGCFGRYPVRVADGRRGAVLDLVVDDAQVLSFLWPKGKRRPLDRVVKHFNDTSTCVSHFSNAAAKLISSLGHKSGD